MALEATWWEVCQACPRKDSSLLHRMAHTMAPVLQDQVAKMVRTLAQGDHHLVLSSSNSLVSIQMAPLLQILLLPPLQTLVHLRLGEAFLVTMTCSRAAPIRLASLHQDHPVLTPTLPPLVHSTVQASRNIHHPVSFNLPVIPTVLTPAPLRSSSPLHPALLLDPLLTINRTALPMPAVPCQTLAQTHLRTTLPTTTEVTLPAATPTPRPTPPPLQTLSPLCHPVLLPPLLVLVLVLENWGAPGWFSPAGSAWQRCTMTRMLSSVRHLASNGFTATVRASRSQPTGC